MRPILLSDHFNSKKLLRFTYPSILMMLATSVYSIVDGIFVSNYVGTTAFAAINFVMPVLSILGIFGYMFGAGGSAIIAKALGENDPGRANRNFSLFVCSSVVVGVFSMILGYVFLRDLLTLFGAEGELLEQSVLYGYIFLASMPAWTLLFEFQLFFVTAQKQKLGLWVILGAGICNVVLDALFIVVFGWGLAGAAAATAISQIAGGLFPVFYFLRRRNTSLLRLCRTQLEWNVLGKCCVNGSSEFLSGVSIPLVGIVYNYQLLKYAGENGVAAYGVIMYVSWFFVSVFIGFCNGASPLFSFNYGAQNNLELKNLLRKCLKLVLIMSGAMFAAGELFAHPISSVFVGYDPALLAMTVRAFRIYSVSFLFMGIGLFASALFTALGNGEVSALISFLRTLVFELAFVLLIPLVWGIDGIWASVAVAEFMAALVGVTLMFLLRKRYGY